MRLLKYFGYALITALVSGCGGGNDAGLGTTYSIVAPQANSQQVYTVTTLDSANNTITGTVRTSITSVNADGSFVVAEDYLTGNPSAITTLFNKSWQELSYTITFTDGTQSACTNTPHGGGPDYPLTIGQTWEQSFTTTCGTTAPISTTESGSVIGIESVTVPAGTFTTLKLQHTIIITPPNGTALTEKSTLWRDINTGISVKSTNILEDGGTVTGTTTMVMESQS